MLSRDLRKVREVPEWCQYDVKGVRKNTPVGGWWSERE